MMTSQNFLIRCGIGVLAGVSMLFAAVATIMLGWIITAHASTLVPGAGTRGESPVLCQIGFATAACPADEPPLVTRPATLLSPEPSRAAAMHQRSPR